MTLSDPTVFTGGADPQTPWTRPRFQERWLYGGYLHYIFEGCLEARLTNDGFVLRPHAWASRAPDLTTPFSHLVCVYLDQTGWTPRLDLVYRAYGGPETAVVAPRNLRAWAKRLASAGVVLRPVTLDRESLPSGSWRALVRPGAAMFAAAALVSGLIAAALRIAGLD